MAQPKIPVDLILKNLTEETESAQKRMGKAADVLLGDLETDIATHPMRLYTNRTGSNLSTINP